MARTTSTLSIVSPMLNEEDGADAFIAAVIDQCEALTLDSFEIVIVDDGSTDRTAEILDAWTKRRSEVRVLTLSRNFGHQAAITAGLFEATGDGVIVMDSDFQDPPDVIPQMVERWRAGVDVVYGVRRKRDGDSWIKRTVAGIFYRLLRWLSDTDIPADAGDFRLISRPVVDVLKSMPERDRYTRGLVSWSGFSQEPLYFDRPERFAGTTKYPVSKLMRLATAGVVGFSDKPLFLTIIFGLGAMVLAVLGLIWVIVSTLFSWGEQIRGWTSMAVLVMFFSAVQLIFLGIVGIYISRIFVEAKHRPIYVIERDSRAGTRPSSDARDPGDSQADPR